MLVPAEAHQALADAGRVEVDGRPASCWALPWDARALAIEFDEPWRERDFTVRFEEPGAADRFAPTGEIEWQYRRCIVVARTPETVVLRTV